MVNANWYEGEWSGTGAVIKVAGFKGVTFSCPACGVELLRGEHRCGDKAIKETAKKAKRRAPGLENK